MKKLFTLAAVALMATSVWAADQAVLDLSKNTSPDTINYNADNHAWTETYNDQIKWLTYGDFMFSHLYGGYGSSYGGYYWDGFVPALGGDATDYGVDEDGNVKSSSDWVNHAWGCMAAGGVKMVNGEPVAKGDGTYEADASMPYMVSYWGYWGSGEQTNIVKFTDGKAHKVQYAIVCNNPWPYYTSVHGDGYGRAFAEGDKFVLHAFGVHEDSTETEATLNLIEYTDGALKACNDWTRFDLSGLGEVTSVYFTLTSTDSGSYGSNTSTIFCLGGMAYGESDRTGIDETLDQREVASVKYVNLAGQQSVEPFDGVNVVVTTYTDGTISSAKVIK